MCTGQPSQQNEASPRLWDSPKMFLRLYLRKAYLIPLYINPADCGHFRFDRSLLKIIQITVARIVLHRDQTACSPSHGNLKRTQQWQADGAMCNSSRIGLLTKLQTAVTMARRKVWMEKDTERKPSDNHWCFKHPKQGYPWQHSHDLPLTSTSMRRVIFHLTLR